MTQTSNLMGLGTPAGQARAIVGGVTINLTATGVGQFDGYLLNGTNNAFSTVPSGSGSLLPIQAQSGDNYRVFNFGANALLVWPQSGVSINTNAVNTSFSIPAGKGAIFVCLSPTLWGAILSA